VSAANRSTLKAAVLRGSNEEGFIVNIEKVSFNPDSDCPPVSNEKGDKFITVLTTAEVIKAITSKM